VLSSEFQDSCMDPNESALIRARRGAAANPQRFWAIYC